MKTIILIDEYDVPLDKAYQSGFYQEMTVLIRNLFNNALKTNDSLLFAVLTGCLRISKESIFTGLNNLNVMTIADEYFSDCFGFTDDEVKGLLEYYGLENSWKTVREWYDGYRFGSSSIYCPWDVMKYCQALRKNPDAIPENYWVNTSGNSLVRCFIHMADQNLRDEIEGLLAGETIIKEIKQELTYTELDSSIENLWSVLFTTGYLTAVERLNAREYRLGIPNMEIRDLFQSQIKEWFREKMAAEPGKVSEFCGAVLAGEAEKVQSLLTNYLKQTISIRDTYVRKEKKENLPTGKATTKETKEQSPSVCFYQGILLGLLSYPSGWSVKSNQEAGDGYSDIVIKDMESDTGIVIEVKYAEHGRLDAACEEALEQIESGNYAETLYDDGMERILKYGIACYKKL